MKLFDRSVDLAQFAEGAPLYPICRAWMKNQPENNKLTVKKEENPPSSPEFQEVEDVSPALPLQLTAKWKYLFEILCFHACMPDLGLA